MPAQVYGNRWEIIRPLREGGQAHTFLVKDLNGDPIDRYVLKRLKNLKRLERFKQEIEAVSALSHPNIVKLVDWDVDSKKPYLVSEYHPAGSLDDNAGLFQYDVVGALTLFIGICDGLALAHKSGIVHRDIKPANILLRGPTGPPVVADFGICFVEGGQRVTLTDEAVGAVRFIAPELEDGRSEMIDPRCDVYSLGKLLYWILNQGTVFAREGHRTTSRDLVRTQQDGSLEHVNRLLDQLIVLEQEERLSSAAEVKEQALKTREAIRLKHRTIGTKVPQTCTFCGGGDYKLVVKGSPNDVNNFGLRAVGGNQYLIFVCERCGHVQFFRRDLAKDRQLWDSQ